MVELLLVHWKTKLLVVAMCMGLKLLGEIVNHDFQRFVLPPIYSLAVSYITGTWWLGLLTLPMIAPIDLGYKDYGSKDSVARALWLFVICVVGSFSLAWLGYISWGFEIPFLICSGWVGTLDRNIWNVIGAPLNGLTIGLPILALHAIVHVAK